MRGLREKATRKGCSTSFVNTGHRVTRKKGTLGRRFPLLTALLRFVVDPEASSDLQEPDLAANQAQQCTRHQEQTNRARLWSCEAYVVNECRVIR